MAIVDSIMYPSTISFERFVYPSRLQPKIQKRVFEIVAKIIRASGLDNCQFNVEMFYDKKRKKLAIIEVNPRMSYQFADLMEYVHGVNSYEILLALANGEKPKFKANAGKYKTAGSFVLRTFKNKVLKRLPAESEILKLSSLYPDIKIDIFGLAGKPLSAVPQDLGSFRYAIINLGAKNSAALQKKFKVLKNQLHRYLKLQ